MQVHATPAYAAVTTETPARAAGMIRPDVPRRALLVIDVQNEYFAGGALPLTHPPDSLPRIMEAMDQASKAGVPVVVVRHTEPPAEGMFLEGSDAWQLRPEVQGRPRD